MKERTKGFVTGLLTAALVLGLGGAALAAGRSIQVDDSIAVTINGVPFSPKNVNGDPVPLFEYNGTTYAPVRAFAGAAGLQVDYDAKTRTARVETPDYALRSDPQAGSYIGAEKAREIALKDAGVAAADARFLRASLDWEDGKAVYDVEFCAGKSEYDYEIDAVTGAILEKDLDVDDFDWDRHDDYHIYGGNDRDDKDDKAPSGLISADKAREIALGKLPGGTVVKCELDQDDGRWEYKLELRLGNAEYECEIDAQTGAVLKWEKD